MARKTVARDIYTIPLESATRKEIDRLLKNLGWNIDEFDKGCNVFTERVKTRKQSEKIKDKFPQGRFPDYVLYAKDSDEPLAVIEAKRVGAKLDGALVQAREYAACIGAKVIFAVDGAMVVAKWVKNDKYLKWDDQLIAELLTERVLLKFVDNGHEIFTPNKATKTREDLISIFKKTNDLLRKEGLREGIERFTEFSNILFLKLIDEIEDEREQAGEERRIEKAYCWDAFCDKPAREMLDYINHIILPKLVGKYNHSGDVFSYSLKIKNENTLKLIVDEISTLTLLDVDSDIKGDAFEYFLKNSVTVGNDLGEYYTPRHIVKLMVSLINPKFGDKVYDPYCGTGGFLIEAFRHIKRHCSATKHNIEYLEKETIYGGELTGTAKIAKMNMILAGDGHTHIKQQDSLANPKKEKFDIILTNFPFAQKTEHAHLYKLSSKSANSVFLKHVIDALKPDGKAAVVVPDSVLFAYDIDSINTRKELITRCEVEAVIQLNVYAFSPYTKQPTSIIIFSKKANTRSVWFFELNDDGTDKRYPDKNDIPELRKRWHEKSNGDRSFTVTREQILTSDCKLFLNYYKACKTLKKGVRLSDICSEFILGGTPPKSDHTLYGSKHLWATIADMRDKYITDTDSRLTDDGAIRLGKKRLFNKGSLLMSFKLTLGKTAFAGADLYTNEAICKLVLKKEYNTDEIKEYLYYILPLINYTPFAQRTAKGATLNKRLLPTILIPFPDKNKRESIVNRHKKLVQKELYLEKELLNSRRKHKEFVQKEILGE